MSTRAPPQADSDIRASNLPPDALSCPLTKNPTGISITVWDSAVEPAECEGLIYTWNGYAENAHVHSLFRQVDIHGERLRRKYLTWIHDFGESRFSNKRIIDHLAIEDGLSYWWLTLLSEQSQYKSPRIKDAIRLLALDEIVNELKPVKVKLVSPDSSLSESLQGLCLKLDIAYTWERIADQHPRSLNLKAACHALPQSIRALATLIRYLHIRWPLRRADKHNWFSGDKALFFCAFFVYMDPQNAQAGHFHSHYWEGLHALLERLNLNGNWLQLYKSAEGGPCPQTAIDWVNRFNRQRQKEGFHAFLDAFLSWRIVLRVLRGWLNLIVISRRLRKLKDAFTPRGTHLSLWPIMKADWYASLRGPDAISNLLWVELFDAALRNMPHQKRGIYTCENQAWERALAHAWRKHGHGQLIAAAHCTIRFWDLRYFSHPRTITSKREPYPKPNPDIVAVNGKAALDVCLNANFSKDTLVESEALRYGYLTNLTRTYPSQVKNGGPLKVLILGDYLRSGTSKTLRLLEAAVPLIAIPITFTMKPHPNCLVKSTDYPCLKLKIVMDPLKDILRDFDIAYSSNMTAAATDAYLAGLGVVVMLDDKELNSSPLRGQPGVQFIDTPDRLAKSLMTFSPAESPRPDSSLFYFLDQRLPRWEKLLLAPSPQEPRDTN
ncbi:MAG TPA: hypothetical protein DEB40_10875 [Elusimicrobia bacterium]|nr:hypothetical protein [Elusimicrobiota bacterium]HBT62233.1 hypothetical protein [Elusimicrobiota bacterium]